MEVFQGLVFIDKSEGSTSHDVVGRLRRILKTKAVGHAGTLDPMATGLMVLLVGEATKFSRWILSGDKSYEASVKFGLVTDSWDRTGEVVSEAAVDIDLDNLKTELLELTGGQNLPVPIFSAIKKDGKKLYEYAREGQEIEEVRRDMDFKEVDFISFSGGELKVRIRCAKGGYIRTFAHVLGQRLGCGACLSALRRVSSEPYEIEQALNLEEFDEAIGSDGKAKNMLPIEQCLPKWPEIFVEGKDEKLLLNGTISNALQARLKWVDEVGFQSGRISLSSREEIGVKIKSSFDKRLISLAVPKTESTYKIARVFKN